MSSRSLAFPVEGNSISKRPEMPVRKLALGILLQAFRDVVAPRISSKEDWVAWKEDAIAWFADEETAPGSLNWVCEILQVNPGRLRHWIVEFQDWDEVRRRDWAKKLVRFHIPH